MFESLNQFIIPVAIIAGSFISGFIVDKIILKYLKKIANRTKWEGDEIVVDALQGKAVLWCLIAGVYFAVLYIPVNQLLLEYIQKILQAVFVLTVTLVLAKITIGFINLYIKKKEGVFPSATIFNNLAKALIFSLGGLIVLQSLGVAITPLLTALGVGGLAVALALQETLSNFFAGLQILASKQIRPGDYVKLSSGEEGTISDITWRNTSILQLSNNITIIPNARLASTILTNYFLPGKEMSVAITVGISFDNDLNLVENISLEVATTIMKEISGSIPLFEPVIRFQPFSDYKINMVTVLGIKEYTNQSLIQHEFIKKLHQRFRAEGIKILTPNPLIMK